MNPTPLALALLAGPALGADAICDLPLIDAPFNTSHGAWPSMPQALAASSCLHSMGAWGIARAVTGEAAGWTESTWARLGIALFDAALVTLPGGHAWLHEEGHRVILSAHGIASRNEVYRGDVTATVIQVSGMADADLAALKRDHPADFVRLAEAGIEIVAEQTRSMEAAEFFEDTATYNLPLYWLNAAQAIFYLNSSLDDTADRLKRRFASQASETERDFAGHDFTSWAYDLHRPDEPYAARGVHPTGAGVDRQRGTRDLSNAERRFLRKEARHGWLNLADPFLVGLRRFEAGPGAWWNARMLHHLTSFGHDLAVLAHLQTENWNLTLALHGFQNDKRWFPGLEAALHRVRVHEGITLSPRFMVWQQPHGQRFQSRRPAPGGLLSARVAYERSDGCEVWTEGTLKSDGWVAGIPYLDSKAMIMVGTKVSF